MPSGGSDSGRGSEGGSTCLSVPYCASPSLSHTSSIADFTESVSPMLSATLDPSPDVGVAVHRERTKSISSDLPHCLPHKRKRDRGSPRNIETTQPLSPPKIIDIAPPPLDEIVPPPPLSTLLSVSRLTEDIVILPPPAQPILQSAVSVPQDLDNMLQLF